MAEALSFNDYKLVARITADGYLPLLMVAHDTLGRETFVEALLADEYRAIRWAIENGHIDMLHYIETFVEPDVFKSAVQAYDYSAYVGAACSGCLAGVQYAEQYLSESECIQAASTESHEGPHRAIAKAVSSGDLETTQHIMGHFDRQTRTDIILERDNWSAYALIRLAAKNGSVAVLTYLLSHLSPNEIEKAITAGDTNGGFARPLQLATEGGHLGALEYMLNCLSRAMQLKAFVAGSFLDESYTLMKIAARHGHRHILSFLIEHFGAEESRKGLLSDRCHVLCEATQKGHVDVMSFLEDFYQQEDLETIPEDACKYTLGKTVSNGYLLAYQKFCAMRGMGLADIYSGNTIYPETHSCALQGHLLAFEHLRTHMSTDRYHSSILDKRYIIAGFAVSIGHERMFEHALAYDNDTQGTQLRHHLFQDNYKLVQKAACDNQIDLLTHFFDTLGPNKSAIALRKIVEYEYAPGYERAQDFCIFGMLASYGKFSAFKVCMAQVSEAQRPAVNSVIKDRVVLELVKRGDVDFLRYVFTLLAEGSRQESIRAWDEKSQYACIRVAAEKGHLRVVRLLLNTLPDDETRQAAISTNDLVHTFAPIRAAAENGHLDVVCFLLAQLPSEIQAKARGRLLDGGAAINALAGGHIRVAQYLLRFATPAQEKETLKKAVRACAERAHAIGLSYVEAQLGPEQFAAAVRERHGDTDCAAISAALAGAHVERFKYLQTYLSKAEFKAFLKQNNYFLFQSAAHTKNVRLFIYMVSFLSTDECTQMLTVDNNRVLRGLNTFSNDINRYLLEKYPLVVFPYFERHEREFQAAVNIFIAKQFDSLRLRETDFISRVPTGVFDVRGDETTLCLQIMRFLIRKSQHEHTRVADRAVFLDDMRFLAQMPSVRQRLHMPMSEQGPSNELVRLAVQVGWQDALTFLLGFPLVRQIAAQNRFYRDLSQGRLDLRALARDAESSMTALSVSEKRQLERVKAHYAPQKARLDEQGGVLPVLLHDLEQRYQENPAILEIDDKNGRARQIPLPLRWADLQELRKGLSESHYKAALKAYHVHDVHSAWRYFLKPNPWMHQKASYVYVIFADDLKTELGRYSTFEEYLHIILPFYLAAIDETAKPVDDYTLEGRIELFIKQLALIARAHNWDNTRVRRDAAGNVIVDENGHPLKEEYDDGEADRPSCFSGVKRRLYQALLGHPLMMILSADIVRQALKEQVRILYASKMATVDLHPLKAAYNAILDAQDVDYTIFRVLDFNNQEKEEIKNAVLAQLEVYSKAYAISPEEWTVFEGLIRRTIQCRFESAALAGGDFVSFLGNISDLFEEAAAAQVQQPPLVYQVGQQPTAPDNETPTPAVAASDLAGDNGLQL